MDTQKSKNEELLLDFPTFIKKWIPEYIFDDNNRKLIKHLGMWASRDDRFNDVESGWHIDRGILLVGVPGVGKDVIFRLLRKYLSYIRSPYGYVSKIVWEYAEPFKKQGYDCFSDVPKDNCYYQELARTDEGSFNSFAGKDILTCSRESVQSFGNKILIGTDLINVRYNVFIGSGIQSHFSTNLNENQLGELYGYRCMDRLREMCNYMILPGESKRGRVAPRFINNKNSYAPPPARETTIDEHIANKKCLEEEYQTFLETGKVSKMASINFLILRSYNCNLGSDEDIRKLMEKGEENYQAPEKSLVRINREEHRKNSILEYAKTQSVINFYQKLKSGGAKSIFNKVDVNVDKMADDVNSKIIK